MKNVFGVVVFIFAVALVFSSCAKSTKVNLEHDHKHAAHKIDDAKHATPKEAVKSAETAAVKTDAPPAQKGFEDMIFVPAGEFIMGKANKMDEHEGHEGHEGHEHHDHHGHHDHSAHKEVDFGDHTHNVYLSPYYIDKYEVTNKQYEEFINAGGYENRGLWSEDGWKWRVENNVTKPNWWGNADSPRPKSGPQFPDYSVTGVSWHEASAYAKWAGKALPTEAQWEKAAKGGIENGNHLYPWGNNEPTCEFANFCYEKYKFCVGGVDVAKSYENGKSPYGAINMSGNVWEWCRDWYDRGYYAVSPSNDPQGPVSGAKKILRGGSWANDKAFIGSTYRLHVQPKLRNYYNGFRCVVELTD